MKERRLFVQLLVLCALLLAAGCTFEPGEPWGYIDTELTVAPVDDSGSVQLSAQSVSLQQMELRAPGQSGDAVDDFDPSDPPAGFSLCHQGHCHHEDGGTYSYEEIEAGIGGETTGPVSIARRDLTTGQLDLTDGDVRHESEFRIVDDTSINEVSIAIENLHILASIDDGDDRYNLEMTLAMATQPVSTSIAYDVGPDSPVRQKLAIEIDWPEGLFDELSQLDEAVDEAEDGDLIEVHGTSNRELRDELIDRIQRDTDVSWIEDEPA